MMDLKYAMKFFLMISYYQLIFSFLYKDCSHTELVANGVCNDESNNAECNFDGGDCSNSTTTQATTSGKKIELIPK